MSSSHEVSSEDDVFSYDHDGQGLVNFSDEKWNVYGEVVSSK